MKWSDETRKLKIRANATHKDAKAVELGAEDGLCRTGYVFEEERIPK